ncbi:hypothetical protein BV25DRAFT_1821148 [Artomyces pyxidatus]|uniref:Uncharacterized protein n=1 Tax=Artomyces pyxidatus TaxID=48021 RepID=A0ACB8TBP0_9AGAM|nr:hypothetical protein BV25DRAFT_1821148 [Artomyces pyxidatus]
MATTSRRPPLNRRALQQPPTPLGRMTRSGSSGVKRPRSPDHFLDSQSISAKRARAATTVSPSVTPAPQDEDPKAKDRRRAEREAQREEFKIKYSRAFPGFSFYIHWDVADGDEEVKENLIARIQQMGSHVEDFFSKDGVTHFITNQSIPSEEFLNNKENMSASGSKGPSLLKSPIRLRGRGAEDMPMTNPDDKLLIKAVEWKMKIWTVAKLESVLDRCQPNLIPPATRAASGPQNLSRLLQSERLHGTTERDPTQKHLGFQYFSKGTYFVLVEDLSEQVRTIHHVEYPIKKGRDGKETGDWPVLYCHPKSRGPFIEFDKNEEKRAERTQKQERAREAERQRRKAKLREQEMRRKMHAQHMLAKRTGDLRRSVSMVNLHRRFSTGEELIDLDADADEESANASGYLASGNYVAASGNSVSVASTAGTTSTSGRAGRNPVQQLPPGLRERLQVTTSRKVAGDRGKEKGDMGPPAAIPERKTLRKSKSTNTMKLPKREEGVKPGYCECCKTKFEDFQKHIISKKHRRFAANDAHFSQLDYVLARLRRQTREEVEEAQAMMKENARRRREQCYEEEDSPVRSDDAEEVEDYLPDPPARKGPAWEHEDIDLDAEGEDDDL